MRLALDDFCSLLLVERRTLFLAGRESKAVNTTPRAALARAFGFSPHFSSRRSPVEAHHRFTLSPQVDSTY